MAARRRVKPSGVLMDRITVVILGAIVLMVLLIVILKRTRGTGQISMGEALKKAEEKAQKK